MDSTNDQWYRKRLTAATLPRNLGALDVWLAEDLSAESSLRKQLEIRVRNLQLRLDLAEEHNAALTRQLEEELVVNTQLDMRIANLLEYNNRHEEELLHQRHENRNNILYLDWLERRFRFPSGRRIPRSFIRTAYNHRGRRRVITPEGVFANDLPMLEE
jgi:hypothetical protein